MDTRVNADLIITNGQVLTVNKSFDIAEAVAVKDGRIGELHWCRWCSGTPVWRRHCGTPAGRSRRN